MEETKVEGKKWYLCIGLLALLLLLVLIPAQSVEAKNPTKKTLKTDKTYTSYDITGDQKPDTIKIQTTQDKYGNITKSKILINGETLYTSPSCSWTGAEIYTLKNGTPYLHFWTALDSDCADVDVLFRYKSGKLKSVVDLYKTESKFGLPKSETKMTVSGNSMKVKFTVDSYTTSYTTFTFNYKYRDGALKRTSNKTSTFSLNFGKGKNKFTTNKKLTVYTSPTSRKTKTLAKGTKIKITQVYQKGSNMYLKYKTIKKKKTGWIKCYKKSHSKDIFKNLFWAG